MEGTKRGLKRKLEEDFEAEESQEQPFDISSIEEDVYETEDARELLRVEILEQVKILECLSSAPSYSQLDLSAARHAAHFIARLARNEEMVNMIVECSAIPALVNHLQVKLHWKEGDDESKLFKDGIEKECLSALEFIALKPEHHQKIVDTEALSHLVGLLKRHRNCNSVQTVKGVLKRAADTISNLALENSRTKTVVRLEGGIPPLVELLEFAETKVKRAAAGALRNLAFKNDENKFQIVECGALPTLILMLWSEDAPLCSEAIGVIGNLVHSSPPQLKTQILQEGALQPVIRLLSSLCSDTKREAALLIGQFAAADSNCKAHIAQRGALQPLIEMLQSSDLQLMEMSSFALGRLAQDTHNQAGIAHSGGIIPLMKLLDSRNGTLQHNAAFSFYGFANNEDTIADLFRLGAVEMLLEGNFIYQPTRDCVAKTLERVKEKLHGRVLKHLLHMMRVEDPTVQRRVALALAHLCSINDLLTVFVDNKGLDLLLTLLESADQKHQRDGSLALWSLAKRATSLSPVDAAPLSPIPQVCLGEQFVNSPVLSDITFLVEGRQFYAHRICLLASSDAFRAMFDGGYREKDAKDVEIPNIRWDVFELMMRFIYTGSVDINLDVAQDLLRAADQYLLDGLRHICESVIAQDISTENIPHLYELSESFNATMLRQSCILFILGNFTNLSSEPWFPHLIEDLIPAIHDFLTQALTRPVPVSEQ